MNIPIKESHRAEEDAKNSGLLFVEILNNEILKTDLKTIQKIENCLKDYDVPNKIFFNEKSAWVRIVVFPRAKMKEQKSKKLINSFKLNAFETKYTLTKSQTKLKKTKNLQDG